MIVTAGSTNVSVYFYIVQDASGTSPGEPVTGLLFSDIETGGSASYVRQGAARTDLTLVTLASASAAHTDGGFILVDDTNMPGLYRCDFPDAAFATGVDQVFLSLVVASGKNAVAAPIIVEITDFDLRTANVTLAAATHTGAVIPTVTTLTGHTAQTGDNYARLGAPAGASVSADVAAVKSETATIVADTNELQSDDVPGLIATAQADLDILTGTDGATLATTQANYAPAKAGDNMGTVSSVTGNVDGSVASVTDKTGFSLSTAGILAIWHQAVSAIVTAGTIGKLFVDEITSARMATLTDWIDGGRLDLLLDDVPTTSEFEARTLAAADYFDPAADTVANVTTVATTTTNTDMRGTDNAALASVATEARLSELDAATGGKMANEVDGIKTEIGTAGAGLTDLGGMSTAMKAEVNAEADTAIADYDPPTNAEFEARTPTAAQLAYIVENAATGMPVTFTTSGGSTTAAVINQVDGASGSATDDQYNGRLLVFTNGTLKGVVTDITDYDGGTTTATITAIPFAPTASHTARLI
jgi:hypothetical protein